MSMVTISCTCTLCGKDACTIQLDDSLDPDQFDLNPICDTCKTKALASQPEEYAITCPWCNTTILLGFMEPGKVVKGECKAPGCDMPIEAWLEKDRLGYVAKAQKLFKSPRSVTVDGESEWEV
jgi:hypothetical protein